MANYTQLGIIIILTTAFFTNAQLSFFDVNVAEMNGIRMISTSDSNYAITDPNFSLNWRTVSVNGDDVIIATRDNNILTKTLSTMSEIERNELSKSKNQVSQVIQYNGMFNDGSGSFSSSINLNNGNIGNHQAKYTTYSSSGSHMSSSSSSSSSFGGNNQMSHYTLNDISFGLNGDNDFAIFKKDKMPFNWSRVFVNSDLLTIVLNNGQVYMKPMAVASQEEIKQLEILRNELKSVAQSQQQQFSQTMQNSMNMMQNMMGNKFQQNYEASTNPARSPYQMSPTVPMNTMNPFNLMNPLNTLNPVNPINQQQLQQQYNQQLLYQQLLQQQILQQLNQQYLPTIYQHPIDNQFAHNVPTTHPASNMLNNNNMNSRSLPSTHYPAYSSPTSRPNNPNYRQPQIQPDRNFQPSQQYYNGNLPTNSLRQSPNQNQSYYSGNLLGQFNPAISATTGGGMGALTGGMFGSNTFPFGPVNSPFGNGFPFNGASSFAIAGRR